MCCKYGEKNDGSKYGLFRLLLGNVPSAVERVSVASGSCRLPRNSANLEKFAPGSASPPRTHTIYNDKDKNKGKDKVKNKGKDNGKDKGKDNDSHKHKYRSPLKLVSCVILVEFLLTLRMDRNWMKV